MDLEDFNVFLLHTTGDTFQHLLSRAAEYSDLDIDIETPRNWNEFLGSRISFQMDYGDIAELFTNSRSDYIVNMLEGDYVDELDMGYSQFTDWFESLSMGDTKRMLDVIRLQEGDPNLEWAEDGSEDDEDYDPDEQPTFEDWKDGEGMDTWGELENNFDNFYMEEWAATIRQDILDALEQHSIKVRDHRNGSDVTINMALSDLWSDHEHDMEAFLEALEESPPKMESVYLGESYPNIVDGDVINYLLNN